MTAEERAALRRAIETGIDCARKPIIEALEAQTTAARAAALEELAKHGHREASYCRRRVTLAIVNAFGGHANH